MSPMPQFSRLRDTLLALCLVVFVAAANWAAFDRFGSDMPDWDQWDAEGLNLLAPWYEGDSFMRHLFEPHNEHRVVLTKLQNLVLTVANGQWDARLECVANSLLHGLLAAGLWLLGRKHLRPGLAAVYYLTLAALYGLPLAWQNILGGFHSQQYWLTGLSLIAITLTPFSRPWSLRWFVGVLAAAAALGSMGSGFLAAAVVIGMLVWRWLGREVTARDVWPTLLPMVAIVAVGVATRVEVPYHQSLKAKTAHDFIFTILRSLEWPLRDHDWAGVILWAPWVIAIAALLLNFRRRPVQRGPESALSLVLVSLGGWVLIQLLATAYARGAGGDYPASRYMDTLIFACGVNGLILARLLSEVSANRGKQVAAYAVALGWVTALAVGTTELARRNIGHELPDTRKYYVDAESHVRAYLATNDQAELIDPIPYPSVGSFLERLAHHSLRDNLPQSVRPALVLRPAAGSSGFLENTASQRLLDKAPRAGLSPATPALASKLTWGSFNEQGAANTAEWKSEPLTAPLGAWLKFETAGDVGSAKIQLELHDAATSSVIIHVRPRKAPGNSWRSAYVRAPDRPFVVVARDADSERWLAFSGPVEMGDLSYVGWQLAKNGLLISQITAGLAIALLLTLFFTRRASSKTTAANSPAAAAAR